MVIKNDSKVYLHIEICISRNLFKGVVVNNSGSRTNSIEMIIYMTYLYIFIKIYQFLENRNTIYEKTRTNLK